VPEHVEPFQGLRHDGLDEDGVAVIGILKAVRQVYLSPVDAGRQGLFGRVAV
jgi:hypothetical protein